MCSCSNEITRPIPERHADLTQETYDKYLGLLEKAYADKDDFQAALQIANLKGSPKVTFDLVDNAIRNNLNICDRVYEMYFLYDRHNFGYNILMLDTTMFKNSVKLCDQLNETTSYEIYAKIKDEDERLAKENREVEDSTHFDMKLVAELEEINRVDQEIRIKVVDKNISSELKEKLSAEMQIIDSLNLIKIDRIFEEHGYPSRELVGKDCNFTPALVIHHSNSLEDRYKYLPFLEKAVEDGILFEGTLDMIKRRIESMELAEK